MENSITYRKIKTISVIVIMAGMATAIGLLASYYYSPEEVAQRWQQEVDQTFTNANKVACEFGKFSQEKNVGDPLYVMYCDQVTEEEKETMKTLAWGSEFREKFNN